jgi:hypothetical protein
MPASETKVATSARPAPSMLPIEGHPPGSARTCAGVRRSGPRMPGEANTCLGCRVAALDRVQRLPWPSRLAFRVPTPAAAFPKSVRSGLPQLYAGSLLRSGVTSSSAMQGMPRSSSTNPLKHDIEALADEPRIGALEGSGLAMPIARSRAAKRAATSQRSLSSMPASCALIAVSSVTTRDAFAGWVFLGSFATLCAVWRT